VAAISVVSWWAESSTDLTRTQSSGVCEVSEVSVAFRTLAGQMKNRICDLLNVRHTLWVWSVMVRQVALITTFKPSSPLPGILKSCVHTEDDWKELLVL
jgi:hypothetical protein